MGEEKKFELRGPLSDFAEAIPNGGDVPPYSTAPLEDSDLPKDSGAAPNPFRVRAEGEEPPDVPLEIRPLSGHDAKAGEVDMTAVDYRIGPEDESSQGSASTD